MIMNNDNDKLYKENEKLLSYLEKSKDSIKYLRICWIDVGNKIRCKSLSVEWILKHRPEVVHVTVTDTCMSFMAFQDSIIIDALPDRNVVFGEVYLIPDVSTITILPYCKSHAQVFGSFYQVNKSTGALEPWKLCPRQCLKKSIDQLSSQFSLSLKGSFEEEFYLIKKNSSSTNITKNNSSSNSNNNNSSNSNNSSSSNSNNNSSSNNDSDSEIESILNENYQIDRNTFASFHSLDSHSYILNEILDNLSKQGIPVEQVLSESGPGQFEITIDYTNIMEACDRHIIFRQTVHSVASLNGYIATFIPKLYDNQAGNGCHAHLSLWNTETGKNITPDSKGLCGVSQITQQFIGGILENANSLTAIFNSTPNSYDRLKPYCWSGCSIAWGLDNKEAFVRVPSNPFSKSCSNFEIKTIDHSSNPYLAIASIIYSGIYGIDKKVKPSNPTSLNPGSLSNKERESMNISFIPSSLKESLDHLKSNDYLKSSLGEYLSNAFIQVKLAEDSFLSKLTNNNNKFKLLELY